MKNFKHPNNQSLVNNFDFADKANPDNVLSTIQIFAEQKKSEIHGKMFKNKFKQNNNALVILVLVVFALAGLCGFTTYQIYRFETGQTNPNPTTQNLIQTANKNSDLDKSRKVIWSGEGFSLGSEAQVPLGFKKEITQTKSEFFDNLSVELSSFLATDTISGDEFISGILIYRTNYDSKLDQQKFFQKTLETAGSDYVSSGEQVRLPGDFVVTKIVPTNKKSFVSIYPIVSTNNYYVIKVFTQGREERTLDQKTQFVDSLITKLVVS